MSSINSRTKGATAEREFSTIIHEWSGIRLIRNLEQSRSGGFIKLNEQPTHGKGKKL